MKGFYTQGLTVLFSDAPDLGVLRMSVEREGFRVVSVEDASDWIEMEGAAITVEWRPEANGQCLVDVVESPWPDDLGDPQESPQLFSAWTMGAFGPHAYPGALERARQFGCPPETADKVTPHSAFVRLRITYVFGAGKDAPIAPSDHEPLAELQWLFRLVLAVMDTPGALLYFNPNSEVLMTRDDLAAHLESSANAKVLPLMAIAKSRLFSVEEGWQMVDTVGMTQLGLPDHEIALPPGPSVPPDEAIRFAWNVALYLSESGSRIETGHTADGPGEQPWRAENREQSCFTPPRGVTHWTLDSAPVEPASLQASPSRQSTGQETLEESSPTADQAEVEQQLHDLGAEIEVWLEQRDAIKARAVAWLKSDEFRAFYDEIHSPWWAAFAVGVLMPWKILQVIESSKNKGLQSKRRWKQYLRLAGEGEVWFALPVIANSAMRSNPTSAWPALLLAPVHQGTRDVMIGGFLSSFLAELYSSPSSTHPHLSAIMQDDTLQVWRRRPLPAGETMGFECVALDMMIKGGFLPPDHLGFIPLLALPGGKGPAVQIPWQVVSPPKKRLISAAEARRKVPPPIPGARPAPKPAEGSILGCVWSLVKVAFVLILGLFGLGLVLALLDGSGSSRKPSPATEVRWQSPPAILNQATLTQPEAYEPLIGQNLQGSGFLMRIPPGIIAGVTSLHQFGGAAPTLLFDLDDNEFTLNATQVYRQPESQIQLVTAATGNVPCLDFDVGYTMEPGEQLRVLLEKGVWIDGTLASSFSTLKGYQSMDGPKMLKMRTQTQENVAGASGSPVIQLATGKVVGVLQGANRADRPSLIEFETLCFTARLVVPERLPATPPSPSPPSSSSDREP